MSKITMDYHGASCEVVFSYYTDNDNLAIALRDEDGFPFATASVNLIDLPQNQVAIKDWSENEGMVDALIEAGIIEEEPIRFLTSGFVMAPVHVLTDKAIKERDRQYKKHEESVN
jgi:hypothetical protein